MATKEQKMDMDSRALLSQKGTNAYAVTINNRYGIRYDIYVCPNDKESGAKKIAIHRALGIVHGRGVALPPQIDFYCSANYEMQNRAYHRNLNHEQASVISLGTTATKGGSGTGLSSMPIVGFDSATLITLHELGHNLHERSVGDRFWTDSWTGKVATFAEISPYAATNKKEFVAEFFCGAMSGATYSDACKNHYRELGGATGTHFP